MPLPLLALLPLLEETTTEDQGQRSFLLPMLAIAAIFYFLMVLPEKKNRKKREELMAGLKKGDKVMMKSGLYGTIVQVNDERVRLQIADGVRVEFAREAIQGPADPEAGKAKAESKDEAPEGAADEKAAT